VDFYPLSHRTYHCIISLFLHIYDYVVLDSGYGEASGSCGGFDPGDA
jgi:hypothetical protein